MPTLKCYTRAQAINLLSEKEVHELSLPDIQNQRPHLRTKCLFLSKISHCGLVNLSLDFKRQENLIKWHLVKHSHDFILLLYVVIFGSGNIRTALGGGRRETRCKTNNLKQIKSNKSSFLQ